MPIAGRLTQAALQAMLRSERHDAWRADITAAQNETSRAIAVASDANMVPDPVAAIAHATDDLVASAPVNWQLIFGDKPITVPV